MKLTFRELQFEHREWADRNFGKQQVWHALAGVMEEIGELAHAILKDSQGIRGDSQTHRESAADAICDAIIFLTNLATLLDLDLQEEMEKTWQSVKARDWRRFPKNGISE